MTYSFDREARALVLDSTRDEHKALDACDRDDVKRYFNFSRRLGGWISKQKGDHVGAFGYCRTVAERAGFVYDGETGAVLTFEERVQDYQDRAEARAERRHEQATKRQAEADGYRQRSDALAECFWGGQPILVGHHSEKRARRDQKRIHDDMRRSLDLEETARYHTDRAGAAERTASGAQFGDPAFLARRIEEQEKRLRSAETAAGVMRRRIEEDATPAYSYGLGRDLTPEEARAARESYVEQMEAEAADARDRLGFYRDKLADVGGVEFDRDRVKAAKAEADERGVGLELQYRRTWYPVRRVNAKTVTVYGWLGFASMEWKVPYAEIEGVRTAPADAPGV